MMMKLKIISEKNIKTSNWFYNLAPIYKVNKLELLDSSNNTYKVTLNVTPIIKSGDSVRFILSDGSKIETAVISIVSQKSFTVRGQGKLDLNLTYKIQRNLLCFF